MKKISTVICCLSLAIAGFFIGDSIPDRLNTISAEPVTLNLPQDLCRVVHDTVYKAAVRDTVLRDSIVYKTKYRTKRVVRTVHHVDTVEVPVLYTRTRGNRKEISPDSLLAPEHKRVTKQVIELEE